MTKPLRDVTNAASRRNATSSSQWRRELPAYFHDVLAYERLCLELAAPAEDGEPAALCLASDLALGGNARPKLTGRASVLAARYDLATLYPRILRGERPAAVPEPCFLLIGRARGWNRARLKRINAATAELLLRCDGTRALEAIAEEIGALLSLGPPDRSLFAAECERFLAPLIEIGLVEVR